jgi:poly(3-hydroxybutyrate) depolymerase
VDYDGEPGEFMLQFDQRDYRLYVPSGYTASSPIPVVVGFHGAGDSGGNFYAVANAAGVTAAAEPANYILIVPDTKSPYSDFAVWSGNPSNDVDEMLVEMDEVLDLVDDVGTHYHLAGDRVHPFGFSDGGLFTAVAGMARSDRFASLTILGYGWGGNYPLVTPDRAIPVQFGCGSNDGFYSGAVSSESFLSGQGHPTRFVTANGVGHSFTGILSAMPASDMFAWMNQHTLP